MSHKTGGRKLSSSTHPSGKLGRVNCSKVVMGKGMKVAGRTNMPDGGQEGIQAKGTCV